MLDNPVRDPRIAPEKFRISVGLPIEAAIDLSLLKAGNLKLFTFAGSLEMYPRRREVLAAMMQAGVPIQLQSGLDAVRFYVANPYRNYFQYLLESIPTLNCPRATEVTGSSFQLKGRFWEAMACGAVLVEEFKLFNAQVDFRPDVVNIEDVDDLTRLFSHKYDLGALLDIKKARVAANRAHYRTREYFRQFS